MVAVQSVRRVRHDRAMKDKTVDMILVAAFAALGLILLVGVLAW
jgi:hypothetical protein